jgi:hypothetical protein
VLNIASTLPITFFKLYSKVFFDVITGVNGIMIETAGRNWTVAITSRWGVDVKRFIEDNLFIGIANQESSKQP